GSFDCFQHNGTSRFLTVCTRHCAGVNRELPVPWIGTSVERPPFDRPATSQLNASWVRKIINTVRHRGRRGARPARREEGEYREYLTDEQQERDGMHRRPNATVFMKWATKLGTQHCAHVNGEVTSRRFTPVPDVACSIFQA